MNQEVPFSTLVGLVIREIENRDNREIRIKTACDRSFVMHHYQDCCEDVHIEDICGDLQDLVGYRIALANETTQNGEDGAGDPCRFWTFYTLGCLNGDVTIRWLGESEYYSVAVDFEEITQTKP